MNRTYCSMPMVECPSCGKEWQWDDYYDVEVNEERECPHCGKGCKIVSVDTSIIVELEPCDIKD